MSRPEALPVILLADDDEDDRELLVEALAEAGVEAQLHWVTDGQALLDHLRRACGPGGEGPPTFVLLDLNMPRKDGREALVEMKADPRLAAIPVIVLSTSRDPADVASAYAMGASSFLTKPSSFGEFVAMLRDLAGWWLGRVELPPGGVRGRSRRGA